MPVPVQVGGEPQLVAMAGGDGELAVGERAFVIDPDRRILMAKPRAE